MSSDEIFDLTAGVYFNFYNTTWYMATTWEGVCYGGCYVDRGIFYFIEPS